MKGLDWVAAGKAIWDDTGAFAKDIIDNALSLKVESKIPTRKKRKEERGKENEGKENEGKERKREEKERKGKERKGKENDYHRNAA
jgi:cobalamin biosynthesis protein CobT